MVITESFLFEVTAQVGGVFNRFQASCEMPDVMIKSCMWSNLGESRE